MSDPLATVIAEDTNAELFGRWLYGTVTAVSDRMATVNLSGQSLSLPFLQHYSPAVGDLCVVLQQGTRSVVIGAITYAYPTIGTVTGTSGGFAVVTVRGVSRTLPYLSTYTPVAADQVLIVAGTVIGKFSTAPVALPPANVPPAPPGVPSSGVQHFVARDAGSFQAGVWRTDTYAVYQGAPTGGSANSGAWFYGTSVQDAFSGRTITVTALDIYLHRSSGVGDYSGLAAHLYTHSSATKPAGDVTRSEGPQGITLSPDQEGWQSLPASWGTSLVAGTRRGIGITGSPYLRLAALDEDASNGTLRITYA